MLPAKALHDAFGLTTMVCTSFQAAGGAGPEGHGRAPRPGRPRPRARPRQRRRRGRRVGRGEGPRQDAGLQRRAVAGQRGRGRLQRRGDEAPQRVAQDPRHPRPERRADLRARAGHGRPRDRGARDVRAPRRPRRGDGGAAARSRTSSSTTSRRRWSGPGATRSPSAACARTCTTTTASTSSWWATTCSRARRSTRCRSPSCCTRAGWSAPPASIFTSGDRPLLASRHGRTHELSHPEPSAGSTSTPTTSRRRRPSTATLLGWSLPGHPDRRRHRLLDGPGRRPRRRRPSARCQAEGMPPHWNCYVTVEDADASAARAAELGATLHGASPSTSSTPGGWPSSPDPQGAVLSVWQAQREHRRRPGQRARRAELERPDHARRRGARPPSTASSSAGQIERGRGLGRPVLVDHQRRPAQRRHDADRRRRASGMEPLLRLSRTPMRHLRRRSELGGEVVMGPIDVPNGGALRDPARPAERGVQRAVGAA